jgi:hypothetical protein
MRTMLIAAALLLGAAAAEGTLQTYTSRERGASFAWDDADWTLSETRQPSGVLVNLTPTGGREGVGVLNFFGARRGPGQSGALLFRGDMPLLRAAYGSVDGLVESDQEIGGGSAHVAEFSGGGQRILRYTIVWDREVMVAALSAPAGEFDGLRDRFRAVVESLRLSPPDADDGGFGLRAYPRKPYLLTVGDEQILLAECVLVAPAAAALTIDWAGVVYRDDAGGLMGVVGMDAADVARQWRVFTPAGERNTPGADIPAGSIAVFYLPFRVFPAAPAPGSVEVTFAGHKADGTPVVSSVALRPVRFETQTVYRLPVEGKWLVTNGPTREVPHRFAIAIHPDGTTTISQRYALDFVVETEGGVRHRGDGSENEQYYCFGTPVHAPAGGTVRRVHDGEEDNAPGRMNARSVLGNYVIIEHSKNECSLLAHLKKGSVLAAEGEKVKAGQIIGQVGNSGNSSEPHLHYQLQDGPQFETADGLPVRFDSYRVLVDGKWQDAVDRGLGHGETIAYSP